MSDEPKQNAGSPMRMDAYYYSFEPTGCAVIDRILSAVACAGKAFHHTECWIDACDYTSPSLTGKTPVEWIQNAANDAAKEIRGMAIDQMTACDQAMGLYDDQPLPG